MTLREWCLSFAFGCLGGWLTMVVMYSRRQVAIARLQAQIDILQTGLWETRRRLIRAENDPRRAAIHLSAAVEETRSALSKHQALLMEHRYGEYSSES